MMYIWKILGRAGSATWDVIIAKRWPRTNQERCVRKDCRVRVQDHKKLRNCSRVTDFDGHVGGVSKSTYECIGNDTQKTKIRYQF